MSAFATLGQDSSRLDAKHSRYCCWWLVLVLLFVAAHLAGATAESATLRVIVGGRELFVEHRVQRGESYIIISRRWTGTPANWRAIRKYNGSRRLLAGAVCKVPYRLILDKYKRAAVLFVFPADSFGNGAWRHTVVYDGETLKSIALWFTGSAKNASTIASYNGLRGRLRPGTRVAIPSALLLAPFRSGAKRASKGPGLVFKKDRMGLYASYRLKKGEALYSSVVVRFTGRVEHKDVMEAVKAVCSRSGIRDVKRIPAGFEVKIPPDLLLAQYLPEKDRRRKEYDAKMRKVLKYRNVTRSKELAGVYVILDPGHGGRDPGAVGWAGLPEDEYVYDIVCRIRRILRRETRAKVYVTVKDLRTGYRVRNSRRLRHDSNEVLLTSPVYRNTDSRVSANLRCYLVASIYSSLPRSARLNNKVVFTSLHADALYRELSGATVYVADAYLSRRALRRRGGIYDRIRESRRVGPIRVSFRQRIRSEGYSRDLASELVAAFARHNIPTLSYHPIRDRIIRGRRRFVPAVIRHNPVPTKLLLEVANLKNPSDCRRLMDPRQRERIARAYVEALKRYYGRRRRRVASQTIRQGASTRAARPAVCDPIWAIQQAGQRASIVAGARP